MSGMHNVDRDINLNNLDESYVDDVKELEDAKQDIDKSGNVLIDMVSSVQKSKKVIDRIQKQMAREKTQMTREKMQEYQELSEEYHEVKSKLDNFPHMIKEQKMHINENEEIAQEYNEEVELLESTFMMEINQATKENGKAKYSNKGMRQAALDQRKKHDTEYQEYKDKLKDAKRELEQAKFELDRIYNEFKSTRKIANMLANRMAVLG